MLPDVQPLSEVGPSMEAPSVSSSFSQELGALFQDSTQEPFVGFYPNPVREHVTFLARGVCWCSVHAIRVKIYDTTGRLVWKDQSSMPMIEYDLGASEQGLRLANGVYFVRCELLIGDTWQSAGGGKLAILQ